MTTIAFNDILFHFTIDSETSRRLLTNLAPKILNPSNSIIWYQYGNSLFGFGINFLDFIDQNDVQWRRSLEFVWGRRGRGGGGSVAEFVKLSLKI